MGVLDTVKRLVGLGSDPYHYECTVCDRTFASEQDTCPDCGGTVERVSGTFDASTVDPSP